MKKLRVLAIMRETLPASIDDLSDRELMPIKTEYDIICALEQLGHEVRTLTVQDDLGVLREAILQWRPRIVFNILEEFAGLGTYVPYVLGYLELMNVHYTGCNPLGLILSDDKALMRKILRHHRIAMPEFVSVPRGKAVRRPRRLSFPLIVKSTTEHGSVGISQASIVTDDEKLAERVQFVHERLESDALVEQYIEGRELYMGILGNRRLETFPIWELRFENLPEGAPRIATEKVKWDPEYQERIGLRAAAARDLQEETRRRIERICKRVYRILHLSAYARMDLRLTPEGKVYLLEPNPNPDLAIDEEFSQSAKAAGMPYNDLIQRILNLGLRYPAGWKQ